MKSSSIVTAAFGIIILISGFGFLIYKIGENNAIKRINDETQTQQMTGNEQEQAEAEEPYEVGSLNVIVDEPKIDPYQALLKKEKERPISYISAVKRNTEFPLLQRKVIIDYTIYNSATIAVYKDFVVRFEFYSKTNKMIWNTDINVYESLEPKKQLNLKKWIKIPNNISKKDIKTVNLYIVSGFNF